MGTGGVFMGNRRYDRDFKREAVRMVVEDGLSIREVEWSLGITYGVLKGWLQKHQEHQDAAFVGRVAPNSPEAELKRLRKENERLQRERDIFKKAVAIFSTDPHRYAGS
jgi:transposase